MMENTGVVKVGLCVMALSLAAMNARAQEAAAAEAKAEDAEGMAKYVYEAAEKGVIVEEYPPVNGVGVYKIIYD